ncbi:hypothetical protein REPUB_Repub17cG0033900 [Reevesia pubescens]
MSNKDVGMWLEEINLGSYRQIFKENGVNGEYLEGMSMFTTEQILRFIRRCHMKWGDFITLCKELRRIKENNVLHAFFNSMELSLIVVCSNKRKSFLEVDSKKCITLERTSDVLENADLGRNSYHRNNWLLSVVNWDSTPKVESQSIVTLLVGDHGKVITVLVATFCKDRVSSSSYTQYSLLTMQYMSEVSISSDVYERVLEKKAPIQVIIPKATVEDEGFLFSMRLRVGGKPSGSAIILSGERTATVSHYYRNSTQLYQYDLPYDAGKVLDASVLPSADDGEDGAWIVLTEKAGIWAIPEKAVVLGGVEPPERISEACPARGAQMKDLHKKREGTLCLQAILLLEGLVQMHGMLVIDN